MSKVKEQKRHTFCRKWLDMEEFQGWLQKSSKTKGNNELAFCKMCNHHFNAHKGELLKHRNSKKHQKKEKDIASGVETANQNEISGYEIVNESDITEHVAKAESSLYAFIEEHNLSTEATDCLVPLCRNIFPDSDIATKIAIVSKRTQTTQIIKKAIGNNLDKLYMKLKVPGMFFSIHMDETTDQSANKQYTLTVVYMDKDNGVQYSFFDMFKVSDSAINLYSSLKDSILSKGIPFANLVGFSSGATVMAEEHNSFFSYLQNDCPYIAYIQWSCHTIHLAASKACLKLPTNVEDLLRNLGLHFSRSYGTQECFELFQEFFHVDIHKFLSSATTRWLSVKECVERVLEQYDTLLTHFQQNCVDDPFDTMQTILDTMNNPFTKAYLQFMSYILGILDEFNKIFQAEKPLLYQMKSEVEQLLQDICLNFLLTDYVKNTPASEMDYSASAYYLPLNQIYLGVSASESIKNLQKLHRIKDKDIESFFENILNFYVELVEAIREQFDFRDELYKIISDVVDPQSAQDFKLTSLAGVWKRFPILKNFINIQALDNEWRKHSFLDHKLEGLDPEMPADDYWHKVSKLKNSFDGAAFPNLYIAMKLLLTLPFFPAQVLPIKEL